jgi:hypothetical protein
LIVGIGKRIYVFTDGFIEGINKFLYHSWPYQHDLTTGESENTAIRRTVSKRVHEISETFNLNHQYLIQRIWQQCPVKPGVLLST